jgi:glycosyltransferase involved in cell wall biosynthesis
MRIITVHNFYQQFGGECQIFDTESKLLDERGHYVKRYTIHNDQIKDMNSLTLAKKTVWNSQIYQELKALVQSERPDVVHFHNTFPLVSPAAYYAVKSEGVPVIQTLNNYRLLCPNALFLRNGSVCEDCLGKLVPLAGVIHGCYKGSQVASATVAAMLTFHRLVHTWADVVDVYVANLTEFAREKLIQGGLPADKIVVKPNFVHPDPGIGLGQGHYALFVGRLAPEKGIITMLKAWKDLGAEIPLKIVGDGSLAPQVKESVEQESGLEWLGRKDSQEVYSLMSDATFLVFPSEWYEGLPRTIIESFAVGTPIIASNLGAMSSLITHGYTGLHFQPGNSSDLVAQVRWILSHPQELPQMRQAARAEFEAKYTAEANYHQLMEIYAAVGAKSF